MDNEYYLIASTLCSRKKFTDDWSTSGSVYAGRLDLEKEYVEDFRPIYDGVYKNHGLTKTGKNEFLIAGEQGIIKFSLSEKSQRKWKTDRILDFPASDIAVCDIDGDGELELGVIAPFHGEHFAIYKNRAGVWEKIYELPGMHEFGHAIFGGTINEESAFLVGFRAGKKELLLIHRSETGGLEAIELDTEKGPANVAVVKGNNTDYICAANRQSNCCSVYGIKK